jgi:glycosyltransferase involved in cell wall biosynthesis
MVNDHDSCWIVIPAFNEGPAIAPVIADVKALFCNVAVVDDGSMDETAVLATAGGSEVLRHPFNLGQGGALQTGISYALARGAEYIATFDADGQHRAEDVGALLERFLI